MRFIFKILLLGLIAVLAYNYFFGNPTEKQQSQDIVLKVEELGKSVADLIKNEKERYDEGKYNDAINKIGSLIQRIKNQGANLELKDELENLNKRKDELKERLGNMTDAEGNMKQNEQDKIDKDLEELLMDLKKLTKSTDSY